MPSPREPERDFLKTRVTPKDDSNPVFRINAISTKNSLVTTPRTTISEDLQPPTESSRAAKVINTFQDEDFSFLVPPPERNDNVFYHKNSFESLKEDHLRSQKPDSFESFKNDDEDDGRDFSANFPQGTVPVTFSPRTKMILNMMKARGLGREESPPPPSSFPVAKPVNFLEPPYFKPESAGFARASFNFGNNNDNYPYGETLRSIQQSKLTAAGTSALDGPSTSSTNARPTEATIFGVPTKPLVPGAEVEHDPYYPRSPTTEAYYTTRQQADKVRKPFFTTTRRPTTSGARFEIPAVLPDLNSLEDLLDRRKFFFIPQVKSV